MSSAGLVIGYTGKGNHHGEEAGDVSSVSVWKPHLDRTLGERLGIYADVEETTGNHWNEILPDLTTIIRVLTSGWGSCE